MLPARILSTPALCAALVVAALAAAGCGSTKHATSTTTPTAAATTGPRDRFGTVWLCRPGERNNPCQTDLTTTVVERGGATHVLHAAATASPPVDCFYVYPTSATHRR